MWAGTHFPVIEQFLKENEFDILCFQEVSGPRRQGNVDTQIDSYKELKRILGKTHTGIFIKTNRYNPYPEISYEGNATFFKKEFRFIAQDILWLNRADKPFPQTLRSYEKTGRAALHITLATETDTFHIVNAHLAWAKTPTEQPHQRKQNLLLITYMRKLKKPWILTGDFNISPENQTIRDLEVYGQNLTKKYDVKNTIDQALHVSWEKIQPGFPIDYIFVSPDVQVDSFAVLENVHMSDHIGLSATLEIL